ncbi:MAG: diaminopimelate dehydrogenase [Bacteroidales bacterium]|nr:diaminopimelate dehydrogenase [Bacteroidales bacterium]
MKRIKVAVVGYGNIGRYALSALEKAADMECVGVVRRCGCSEGIKELEGYKVVSDISELGQVDVAILATPSRSVGENAFKYLSMGISTVDSFDIHSGIRQLRSSLMPVAKANNAVSIISAGWDPGTDSIIRALVEAMVPEGDTYTNFGPGRSMGHSVVAASKPGVIKALSMTIPVGKGIHRREVYVELEPGCDFASVEKAVREDPYFVNDETAVFQVPDVGAIDTHMHGVKLERSGLSGKTEGQQIDFNMRINNPALTGQILVSAARAATKQSPGCYTTVEIPVIDFLPGERDELIGKLV